MALTTINDEINEACNAYLELRGRLRDDSELDALDGVYNALKSPQRLLVYKAESSVDQKCESLEYMITSLHRVLDLMRTLRRSYSKRTGVGNMQVDCAIETIKESPSFLYFHRFTNAVKHTVYVQRGRLPNGTLFFDGFDYKDRGKQIQESLRTADQIIEAAREVIRLSTNAMLTMSRALEGARTFDPKYSEVCATPTVAPNLYEFDADRED